eukprot:TRINITY_DN6271_c0_g1_i1.p1 TRINITY_DN6271_c0_g1~~TRINITY_DN6271_c0_g1_i1.p1  ORF type:complete len:214 (+),score=17.79 TRINITY_DN6271_c0_g1_i1:39-644(+)
MYLVALVAAVAIVKAQIPAHCHTPAEWEGRTSTWDHGANRHDTGRVVYDASNERVRFIDDINTFAPGRRAYEHLVLYRENIQYRVDLTSRECQKGPIDKRHAWHAFGIPVNATFQGERNIGALDETITASEVMWLGSNQGLHAGGSHPLYAHWRANALCNCYLPYVQPSVSALQSNCTRDDDELRLIQNFGSCDTVDISGL